MKEKIVPEIDIATPVLQFTLAALTSVQKSNMSKQKTIDMATIQEGSVAQIVAQNIFEEIVRYQSKLPEKDDVVMCIVQQNQSTIIHVDSIGYIGYNIIRFGGLDNSGKPLELLQHVSQLNFLLTVESKPNPEVPKRRIGFVAD